jgi:hypothetical protein
MSCISINYPLIVIGGLSLTEMLSYKVNYSKLWKDPIRNLNGDIVTSFIGIFPNIDAKTVPLTQSQAQTLCAALDQPYFSATVWDPSSNSRKTANYYASDYSIELLSRVTGKYASVEFSIIPLSRR